MATAHTFLDAARVSNMIRQGALGAAISVLATGALGFVGGSAQADEPPAPPPASGVEASGDAAPPVDRANDAAPLPPALADAVDTPEAADDTADDLIRQLDASAFSERQRAMKKLKALGPGVIPQLEKAAQQGSREVTQRCLDLLGEHFDSADESVKKSAQEALERLARCDSPSASRRADEILNPNKTPPPPRTIIGGAMPLGGFNRAQIQMRVIGGGGARRISIKNINGVKQIDVDEGGRKIKINDAPQNGIKMEVTEKKDGKDIVKKYEAKNAEELKKNHPEAHKIYDKYSYHGAGPVIQFGGGNIQLQGQFRVLPLPAAPKQHQPQAP